MKGEKTKGLDNFESTKTETDPDAQARLESQNSIKHPPKLMHNGIKFLNELPLTPFLKIKAHQQSTTIKKQSTSPTFVNFIHQKNANNRFSFSLRSDFHDNARRSECSPLKNPHKKGSKHSTKRQCLNKKTASRQAAKEQFGRVKRRERPSLETRVSRSQQCRRMPRLHTIANTTHHSFEATRPPHPSGQTPETYDAKHARTQPSSSQAVSPDVVARSRLHRH